MADLEHYQIETKILGKPLMIVIETIASQMELLQPQLISLIEWFNQAMDPVDINSEFSVFQKIPLNFPFTPSALFLELLQFTTAAQQKCPQIFAEFTLRGMAITELDQFIELDVDTHTATKIIALNYLPNLFHIIFLYTKLNELFTRYQIDEYMIKSSEISFVTSMFTEHANSLMLNWNITALNKQIKNEKSKTTEAANPFSNIETMEVESATIGRSSFINCLNTLDNIFAAENPLDLHELITSQQLQGSITINNRHYSFAQIAAMLPQDFRLTVNNS